MGSLLVGVSFAKALAYRLGIPLVGVHHLAGHLASAELASPGLAPPYLGLVISGGHTALYRISETGAAVLLGETRDDAVGEAFDKVAKLLGLAYPGGPAVARAAASGNAAAFDFPRPLAGSHGLDFSFSGLKTAVALEVERQRARGPLRRAAGGRSRGLLRAGGGRRAARACASRARRRSEACRGDSPSWAASPRTGGCAPPSRPRRAQDGFEVIFPPLALCTDNAAMIAAAGAKQLARGERHGLALDCFSRVPMGAAPWAPPARGVNASSVRAMLARHGLLARRDLGQNFLVDDAMAARLVELAGVEPGETVIEIGAGLGTLTRALAARAARVVALEIDAGLVRALRAERLLPDNVELLHADALSGRPRGAGPRPDACWSPISRTRSPRRCCAVCSTCAAC